MKKGFERKLPSELAAAKSQFQVGQEKMAEDRKRKEARELAAFDWLLKQENGRIVWAWFFERCGYNKAILLREAGGDVAPISTECAAAQREVYRDARKKILAPELLAQAEFEAEFARALVPHVAKKIEEGEKK